MVGDETESGQQERESEGGVWGPGSVHTYNFWAWLMRLYRTLICGDQREVLAELEGEAPPAPTQPKPAPSPQPQPGLAQPPAPSPSPQPQPGPASSKHGSHLIFLLLQLRHQVKLL